MAPDLSFVTGLGNAVDVAIVRLDAGRKGFAKRAEDQTVPCDPGWVQPDAVRMKLPSSIFGLEVRVNGEVFARTWPIGEARIVVVDGQWLLRFLDRESRLRQDIPAIGVPVEARDGLHDIVASHTAEDAVMEFAEVQRCRALAYNKRLAVAA